MEGIVVLGSTGSIGVNTLSVIRQNPDRFRVDGLSCNNNIELLADQIGEFSPKMVSVSHGNAKRLKELIKGHTGDVTVLEGKEGHIQLAKCPSASKLVAAMVGAAGIEPVMAGIKAGKAIALANKESLVLAGSLLISEVERQGVEILPIDSEHNAIFQSLHGEKVKDLDYITLTASGGPFRRMSPPEFENIVLKDALTHPNWDMGKKITIDSATMMNKCLEIIEAKWLFNIDPEQIRVLIHPQSIVHSMVTFKDASTICQMGVPDMRIPIANCLGYPNRIDSGCRSLDLAEIGSLTFEKPDIRKFPTLKMAYDVLRLGGGAPAALNGANEVIVDLFLEEKIRFLQIFELLQNLVDELKNMHLDHNMERHPYLNEIHNISDALEADLWGRNFVKKSIAAFA
ncbi:MAG: 1-deoxy-D-xylulose-5-phosphate reductoisomerase [Proteobacteria bacterium]|nr:1-deoxy-D-xylulose-5-phosphate reductoisomerase [Pseudomonadota bacterium]